MGRESPMNVVGTVSEKEAKDALCLHKGNVWDAVVDCVNQRQKKVSVSYDSDKPKSSCKIVMETKNLTLIFSTQNWQGVEILQGKIS